MAKKILFLDEINKRVYLDVDAGSETVRTVQEIGSLIKQELQKSSHIDQDAIFVWSGNEIYDPVSGATTGVVMNMLGGWTLWTANQGSPHKFRIINGLVLVAGGGDPVGNPTNIVWSLSEQSVSNVQNLETLESQQTALQTDTTLLLQLAGNDQEWVTPGLLKIYNNSGKVGGVTVAEFETRDSAGVQTFDITKVRQYIRTK